MKSDARQTETRVRARLQELVEKEVGMIPLIRGLVPSPDLLFQLYHFYWDKDEMDIPYDEYIINKMVCSDGRQHVLKLAEVYYNLSFSHFNREFHTWNRQNNPHEYPRD